MVWEGIWFVLLVVCLVVVCSNDIGLDNVGFMVIDKVRLFIYFFIMLLMLLCDGWNFLVCLGMYICFWFVKINCGENVFFRC